MALDIVKDFSVFIIKKLKEKSSFIFCLTILAEIAFYPIYRFKIVPRYAVCHMGDKLDFFTLNTIVLSFVFSIVFTVWNSAFKRKIGWQWAGITASICVLAIICLITVYTGCPICE